MIPSEKSRTTGIEGGKATGSGLINAAVPFCSMMATPKVAISVISTSRPRSGRRTKRSRARPTIAAPTAPKSSTTMKLSEMFTPASRPANMPTMKISGWAKLTTRRTVNTSAKPIATTA